MQTQTCFLLLQLAGRKQFSFIFRFDVLLVSTNLVYVAWSGGAKQCMGTCFEM